MSELTHLDERGHAVMVDVSEKVGTVRTAVAQAEVHMLPGTLDAIRNGDVPKGDVLAAARIAGIDVIIGVSGKGAQAGAPPATAPQVVTGPAGKPVLLAQTASFGHYLGKLAVTFDRDGHPKTWKGDQIRLDRTVPEDPDIHAQVEAYAAALGTRRTQLSQLPQ